LKKNDYLWAAALLGVVLFLIHPVTNNLFVTVTKVHPYVMGFIKISILATMGDLLAVRITSGEFKRRPGILYRFIVWGFLGMAFVLVFDLFANGVSGAMKDGLLQKAADGSLLKAFFSSLFNNLIFAPTFMAFHRIIDTYIDMGEGRLGRILKVRLVDVVHGISWHDFISFVVLKTIPIFWIPMHTITYMLPNEYRILMLAFLSIMLGVIMALAKKRNLEVNHAKLY